MPLRLGTNQPRGWREGRDKEKDMEHDLTDLTELLERYATAIERELAAQDNPHYHLTDVRNAVHSLLTDASHEARELRSNG